MSGLTIEDSVLRQFGAYRGDWHRQVVDELEVGVRAANVWDWSRHYLPPVHEPEVCKARRSRFAQAGLHVTCLRCAPATELDSGAPELGQLDLFTGTAA